MAVVIGNKQSNTNQNFSVDFDINLPTGLTAGDVIILLLHNSSSSSTMYWSQSNAPTGYTFEFSNGGAVADNQWAVYWKAYTGGEGSTITINNDSSSNYAMGYAMAVSGTQYDAPIGNIGTAATTATANTLFTVDGISGDTGDIQFIIGGGDGGDVQPWTITNYTKTEYRAGTSGIYVAGFHGPRTSVPTASSARDSDITGSVSDGAGAQIFRIALGTTTVPTEIREKLCDSSGVAYANGTEVHCYKASGELEWVGSVGSITGQNPTYPSTPASGEVVFTFALGDTASRFLVVDPPVDTNGLVTNLITPIQL